MADINFEEQLLLEEEEKRQREGTSDKIRIDPDGTTMEFDEEKKAWFPKIDANFIAQYQMNYGNFANDDTDNTKAENNKTEATESKSKAPGGDTTNIPPAPPVDDPGYYDWYYTYYYPQMAKSGADTDGKKEDGKENKGESKEDEEARRKAYAEYYAFYYGENYEKKKKKKEKKEGDENDDEEEEEEEEEGEYDEEYWNYYYNYYYQQGEGGEEKEGEEKDKEEKDKEEKDKEEKGEKKEGEDGKEEDKKAKKRKANDRKGWFEMDQTKSTSVYVQGLPTDTTDEEFKELMNKCGLIMFDPFTNKPKLKLYRDGEGKLKGDGLCVYIKPESVELALQILDGYDVKGQKITVEVAKFEMKGKWDATKAKRKKMSNKQKKKMKERQERLFGWKLDKPKGFREKHECVIVIKNLFDIIEYQTDVLGPKKLKKELEEECSKYGDVKKVIVYDRHQEGPAMVTFQEAEEADMCKANLDGRLFRKRVVKAETWDGRAKFVVEETDKEKEARLGEWEKFLEGDEKAQSKNSKGSPSKSSKEAATEKSTVPIKQETSKDSLKEDASKSELSKETVIEPAEAKTETDTKSETEQSKSGEMDTT